MGTEEHAPVMIAVALCAIVGFVLSLFVVVPVVYFYVSLRRDRRRHCQAYLDARRVIEEHHVHNMNHTASATGLAAGDSRMPTHASTGCFDGASQAGTTDAMVMLRSDLDQLERWLDGAHNPLNGLMFLAVVSGTIQLFSEALAAVLMFALGRYKCVEPVAGLYVAPGFGPVLCSGSATVEQFLDTYTLSMLFIYVTCAAVPGACKSAADNPQRFTRLAHAACIVLGLAAVVVMWAVLPVQPWGSRFAQNMAWCWIPDKDQRDVVSQRQLDALRTILSYGLPVLMTLVGCTAYSSIRAGLVYVAEMRYNGDSVACAMPREHTTVVLRLVLQLGWLLVLYGLGAASRYSENSTVPSVISAAMFSVAIAGNAALWAYGEGFLALAYGCGTLHRAVLHPCFSQVVMAAYGAMPTRRYQLSQRSATPVSEYCDGRVISYGISDGQSIYTGSDADGLPETPAGGRPQRGSAFPDEPYRAH